MLAWLLAVQPAGAAKTDLYENFTACPTDAPEMNSPTSVGAVCVSSVTREGLIKVGNFQAPITSPLQIQFAFTSEPKAEPGPEEPATNLVPVPHSVSLNGAPMVIPNPFYTPPAAQPPAVSQASAVSPSPAPAPEKNKKNKKKKKHRKHKQGKHKHRKHKKGKGKAKGNGGGSTAVPPTQPAPQPAPAGADPFIKGTIEVAGELQGFSLSAVLGEPEPMFELPVKLHLEGTGLGQSCYVGSNAEPIVLAPIPLGMPKSFQFAMDPNGFNVEYIGLGGASAEDDTFAVAGARGCGQVNLATGQGSLDPTINALIGLPAVSGGSKAILQNVLIELAGAGNNSEPPESGEELRAAFEAAR